MVESSQGHGWWPDLVAPFRQMGQQVADWFSPRSDAAAAAESYRICLELPGVKIDDIAISLHEGLLTVTGEKKLETREEGEGYFFSERQYGRFQRSFRLPPDAGEDGVTAAFNEGVLTITVPKRTPEQPKARRIEISR